MVWIRSRDQIRRRQTMFFTVKWRVWVGSVVFFVSSIIYAHVHGDASCFLAAPVFVCGAWLGLDMACPSGNPNSCPIIAGHMVLAVGPTQQWPQAFVWGHTASVDVRETLCVAEGLLLALCKNMYWVLCTRPILKCTGFSTIAFFFSYGLFA